MLGISVQLLTLAESALLLVVNAAGVAVTLLAWHASEVDVREARAWKPPHPDAAERIRLKHNRLVVTTDARHGEVGRLLAHLFAAMLGVVWIVTPQPTNPDVVWWAVIARCCAIGFSVVLIDKTLAHLAARYRFDKPWLQRAGTVTCLWPALRLAWSDMRAPPPEHRS